MELQKIEQIKSNLSEEFRKITNEKLLVNFDQNKWQTGWPMVPISKLNTESFEIFRGIITDFVKEIKANMEV